MFSAGASKRSQSIKGTVFLAASAVVVLASNGAFAASHQRAHKPHTLLWNQNSNFGQGVDSDNDEAAADDFTIPAGQAWHIAEVDVTGAYFNGSGPASAETITFYSERNRKPRRVYAGPFTLNCTDNDGSFKCILPRRVKLPSGTWWVSVVASCNFQTCGEWRWTESTRIRGNGAMWEDPEGDGKCISWKPLDYCFGGPAADLAFDLIGKVVKSN